MEDYNRALTTCLGLCVSRLADFCSAQCTWFYDGGRGVKHTFGRQALQMVWDYAETAPLNANAASWQTCLNVVVDEIGGANEDTRVRKRRQRVGFQYPTARRINGCRYY